MYQGPDTVSFFELSSAEESVARLKAFCTVIESVKSTPPHATFDWYPYNTLANWVIFQSLLAPHFSRLQHALRHRTVLDVGCGDGDLTFFLSQLGCCVTAIDNPETNFNFMYGVRALKERLKSRAKLFEIDIDSSLSLPEDDYGLVLLLGILYHVKNPFSILERLARCARYCMLSTRIAAETPKGMPMQGEALAYLVDSRETNDDPTNFWIFSETGLLRILERTGWEVCGSTKLGCLVGSNPSSNAADERMFVFLRSRLRSAPAKLELVSGWWPPGPERWCWVNKSFALDVALLEAEGPSEFELRLRVPKVLLTEGRIAVSCSANGIDLGSQFYSRAGDHAYRAAIPSAIDRNERIRFQFSVRHDVEFGSDARDLGVIVPWRGEVSGIDSPISFWIG